METQGLSASPNIQDVSRAWDSLMEAKHVLQRIEDKVDTGNQRRSRGQRIRRRLQMENLLSDQNSLLARDTGAEYRRSEEFTRKSEHTFTLHSKEPTSSLKPSFGSCNESFLKWSPKSSNLYLSTHGLSGRNTETYNFDSSLKKSYEIELQDSFSGRSLEEVLKTPNLGPQTCNQEKEEKVINPYLAVTGSLSGQNLQGTFTCCSSPETSSPLLSPKTELYAQKLEYLKQNSHSKKLEKLKERIREQKRHQEVMKRNLIKPRQNTEHVRKCTNVQKIRKVTFGPPAPVYKGFSASCKEATPVFPEGCKLATEKENLKKTDHWTKRSYSESSRATKVKARSPMSRKPSTFQEKERHSDCPHHSVSAWREGQKLVHQILGPSPVTFKKRRVYKNQEVPPAETCRKGFQKVRSQKPLKPSHVLNRQESDQSATMLQVLRDIQAGREGSDELCGHLEKPGVKNKKRVVGKISPKIPFRAQSVLSAEKENSWVKGRERPRSSRAPNYSVEEVRIFMRKKKLERKQAEREGRRKLQKASQTRQQQLCNILKRQKEACPPKRASSNVRPQLQVMAEEDAFRTKLSEWLRVTSLDLLKEEHGGKGDRKMAHEEPCIHPSTPPLQLQDLTATPSILQRDGSPKDGFRSTEHSPYRDSRERVQALLAAAKDLGRKVEQEITRLATSHPNNHVTPLASPPTRPGSSVSKPAKTEGRHNGKNNELGSTTMDSTPASNWAKPITGEVKKEKGYTEENIAQPMKSQSQFRIRGKQKPGFPVNRSPQRGSDWHNSKSPQTMLLPSDRLKSGVKAECDAVEEMGGSAALHHGKSAPKVSDLHQTRMEITNKMKIQLEQQERELAMLRAEREAREAKRCKQEMLRAHDQQVGSLEKNPKDPEQSKLSDPAGMRGREAIRQRFESPQENFQKSVKPKTHAVPENPGKIPERSFEFSVENDISERSCNQTDPATDSTSKWSEVSEFYGSSKMFGLFSLDMTQQYLREEELRARHQTALLRLREEVLQEKTKAELALLGQQRTYWELKKEKVRLEEISRQEEEIQRNLKQEQAEIRHLQNIYKAAHQERKLLLKQQKDIQQIQRSAADILQKLRHSAAAVQVPEGNYLEVPRDQATDDRMVGAAWSLDERNQDTESAISDLSADDDFMDSTPRAGTERTHTDAADQSLDASPVYPGSPNLPVDIQSSSHNKQRASCSTPAEQDEGELINPFSENRGRVTGPPIHLLLTLPEDPTNHSQKKRNSADEDDPALFATKQRLNTVPARDYGGGLECMELKTKAELDNPNTPHQLNELHVITSGRESAEDAKLESEANIASIVTPSQSLDTSPALSTAACLPSLAEFHKVSAKLINISESSISLSDRGQDTESGDSDVFDMESTEFPAEETIAGDPLEEQLSLHKSIVGSDCKDIQSKDETSGPGEIAESVLEECTIKRAPLASESFPTSENATESESKTFSDEHLPKIKESNTVNVTGLQKATSMGPGYISNVAGMSLSDTKERPSVTETNAKQSVTENVIFRKMETAPSKAPASKDLFQIKSFPHQSEAEVRFIRDEALQQVEDTLSEIFSPVDEELCYESAELYSAKQDPSEELPSLPKDVDDTDTEDFPTPPEEIFFSGSGSLQSSQEASLMEEINILYDNLLTEDAFLPVHESLDHENLKSSEDKRNVPELVKLSKPFLTLSKVEDDLHDPMLTFETGDRVLVKQSKPGTIKYKGLVAFREGYWAGVALDKAEGDNDGTYEGIRYFECPEKHGIFVGPEQISHLLFELQVSSDPPGDNNDSPSEGPSPKNTKPQDQAGSEANKEGQGSEPGNPTSGKKLN